MSRPRVGSLFAGVEGFGQGLEAAGFEVAWQVEIDKDAVSVLERHYPNVRRYRDVREVKGAELEPVDVLVGGFPCQDLSVAGARKGLAGERSGLFFEVARIAAETATPWLLLENVDGLLSQWTPVEAPPSGVAVGTEWEVEESPDLGLVISTLQEHGYLGCLRVLDAQYFGVAQRRERVFIVGHLGATGERALEVLLEPESVLRDLASCLEAGQRTSVIPEDGVGLAGVPDVAFTLRHNTNGTGASDNAWNTTYVPAVSVPLTAAMDREQHNGQDDHSNLLIAAPLTAGGHPNSNMPGRHREDDQNLVAAFDERNVTSGANRTRCEPGLPANTLHSEPQSVVAFNWQAGGDGDTSFRGKSRQYIARAGDYAGALSATRHDAVAFHTTQDPINGDVAPALSHESTVGVQQAWSVRRLMPVECERLMGWSDDWTRYRADGSEIADGPRYRMIGNGVVAPVSAWIGHRLMRALRGEA